MLQAVLRHRSVSVAERELGVTASAISHAFARLHQAIGDELFVSSETGTVPKQRARELVPSVHEGLERISPAVSGRSFVPSETPRTFRIAETNYFAITMLPQLVQRMIIEAPRFNLNGFPSNRLDVVRELDDGRINFMVSWSTRSAGPDAPDDRPGRNQSGCCSN